MKKERKLHDQVLLTFALHQHPWVGVRGGLPKGATAEPPPQQDTTPCMLHDQLYART